MSTRQILEELPKLSHEERLDIARRIREIEDAEEIAIAESIALQGFQMMDELEAAHEAKNSAR